MTQQLRGMDPLTILAEVDGATTRLENAAVVDQKKEFLSNVYPLLRLLTESVGFRFADMKNRVELMEHAVADFLTGSESMILPELAARIQATFAIGIKLCSQIEEHFADAKVPAELLVLIEAYRGSAQIAVPAVADVTAEEIDDDGDEDDPEEAPINGAAQENTDA